MATLFERLISTSVDGTGPQKISIHMLQSLIIEFREAKLTRAQVRGILGLETAQEDNLITLYQALQSANNKQAFWQRVFAHLILAENHHRANDSGLDGYLVEANFWTMVSEEAAK